MSDLVSEIRQRIAVSMAAADNKNYCIVWTIKEANATADRIEKLVDECCQLKEGYTSIRVQFATFTKTVGGAFANAFKEGFMEGWMDGKHGTSPDPSPVVDAAWEKSKHINFINMVDCGGDAEPPLWVWECGSCGGTHWAEFTPGQKTCRDCGADDE